MIGISIVWPTHHCLQTTHMIGHHSLFRVGATFPGMLSGFTHTHVKTLQTDLRISRPSETCLPLSFLCML